MKNAKKIALGLSIATASMLFADANHMGNNQIEMKANNHMGNHMMSDGKMGNHMNPNNMTDEQMKHMNNSY